MPLKIINAFALPILLFGVLIAVWSTVSIKIPGFPTPMETWNELCIVLSDPLYNNGAGDQGIALQLMSSLKRVFGGFALAIAVGIPVGLLIGMSKNAYTAFNPYIQILKPVSPLAWLPLALFVFKEVNYTLPATGWKVEGKATDNKFMDGSVFDPNKVVDYIYNSPIKHPKITKEALAKVNKWKVKN